MPVDLGPPPAWVAPATELKGTTIELARVDPDGVVRIDWKAVQAARLAIEPQLRHMAELLTAARDGTDKPLDHIK